MNECILEIGSSITLAVIRYEHSVDTFLARRSFGYI
jgi:hypothetical protein